MAKFWDNGLGWVGSGWPRYHNNGWPPEVSPGVYEIDSGVHLSHDQMIAKFIEDEKRKTIKLSEN